MNTIEEAYIAVSVSHMAVHDNTSGHLQLLLLRLSIIKDVLAEDPCNSASVNPSFVGGAYFSESGVNSESPTGFHSNDPLWDGEGCSNSSSPCSFNNPPYFTKQHPSPTSDPIEARF